MRITLVTPPADVVFGIQEGKGSNYTTVLKQRSIGSDVNFEFQIAFKGSREDGSPNFVGPYAQGPASARFVYIDTGVLAGETNTPWERRLKVSLSGINAKMATEALADAPAASQVAPYGDHSFFPNPPFRLTPSVTRKEASSARGAWHQLCAGIGES